MKIAVLDIETTGRTPDLGTIVEVGICMLDLNNKFKTRLLDTTCKEHDFEVKFEATTLGESWVFGNSNLTIKEISIGPSWDQVAPKIQKILNKFPATAYNKQFDFGFLRDRGIRIVKELECPMIKATPILKLPGKYDDYKWPSVQETWDFFFSKQNDYKEIHRAYDDAFHEADIIYELYKINAWNPIIHQ